MNCPNCHNIVEEGAAYCGNCGQALLTSNQTKNQPSSHIAQVLANQPKTGSNNYQPQYTDIPAYAIATPLQHEGETKAVLSLLFGVVGIVGSLFVAVVGITLGIVGLVLGTMARNTPRKTLSTLGIVFSCLAIIVSLGVWAYAVHKQTQISDAPRQKANNIIAADMVSTPCYNSGFIDTLNVSNTKDSCNMNAFNGQTLETSTKAYKVYSSQIAGVKEEAFNDFAKRALQKDVATNLAGFTVVSESFTQFAGSPAYVVQTIDKKTGVSVTEAIVLRQVRAGSNVFVLVQASTKGGADLSTLEAQWQWK